MTSSDDYGKQANSDQRRLIDAAWEQFERIRSTQATPSMSPFAVGRHYPRWNIGDTWPEHLPGYHVDEEIHRGGQGVVYRAVQESTHRTVAIKVMREGPFAGPRERARFEREVQILAQLRHPNIVTIHDSGIAGSCAFFVMDYIPGFPLDEFAERRELPLRRRLELFATICDAVNVAHLRGVIHRDLKPGNIRIDESGAPHILDFGLAKQAQEIDDNGSSEQHALTATGQFLGSLPWASPEQAEGRLAEIDVRTDVYALGVMLYKLLTGDFPYDVVGSIGQITRNIVECDPKNPRTLNKELDDEVTTIVLKAIRKERNLRYQSAGELGRDIRRYLLGQPIEAKRDSMSYVLRKHFARHKLTVGVVAAFVAIVTFGFVASFSFWQQAERRADEAAAEAGKARAVTDFVTSILAASNPLTEPDPDITVREVVAGAVRELENGRLTDQPGQEAAIRTVIGTTYRSMGLYDMAIDHLTIARNLYDQLGTSETEQGIASGVELAVAYRGVADLDRAEATFREMREAAAHVLGERHPTTLDCTNGLAEVMRDRGNAEEAERLNRQVLSTLYEIETETGTEHELTPSTMNDLALTFNQTHRNEEAIELQTEVVDRFTRLRGRHHHETAVGLSNLAGFYADEGNFEMARKDFEEAIEIFREIVGDRHLSTASSLGSLGMMLLKQHDFEGAKRALSESYQTRKDILGPDHPLVANSLNNLAVAQYQLGEMEETIQSFREVLRIYLVTYGEQHPSVATIRSNLAALHRTRGEYGDAIELLREALATRTQQVEPDDPLLATSKFNLGKTLMDAGQLEEAEGLLREALTIQSTRFSKGHKDTTTTMDALAAVLQKKGRLENAEDLARQVVEIRRAKEGKADLPVAESLNNLAGILFDQERWVESEALYEEAVAIASAILPDNHRRLAIMRGNWGGVQIKLHRFESAEGLLLSGHGALLAVHGENHPDTCRTVERLTQLYEAWGRSEQAEEWRRRLASPSEGEVD